MINLNQEIFVLILFIAIFISSILKIIAGIVCHGDIKKWGLADSVDGIIWFILCMILLII